MVSRFLAIALVTAVHLPEKRSAWPTAARNARHAMVPAPGRLLATEAVRPGFVKFTANLPREGTSPLLSISLKKTRSW